VSPIAEGRGRRKGQIGDDRRRGPAGGVNVDLARRLQHLLHCIKIEPPRGQFGVRGETGLQRVEPFGVAARLVERLFAIDLRLLLYTIGLGAGAR
jgi:hypothetical protein